MTIIHSFKRPFDIECCHIISWIIKADFIFALCMYLIWPYPSGFNRGHCWEPLLHSMSTSGPWSHPSLYDMNVLKKTTLEKSLEEFRVKKDSWRNMYCVNTNTAWDCPEKRLGQRTGESGASIDKFTYKLHFISYSKYWNNLNKRKRRPIKIGKGQECLHPLLGNQPECTIRVHRLFTEQELNKIVSTTLYRDKPASMFCVYFYSYHKIICSFSS